MNQPEVLPSGKQVYSLLKKWVATIFIDGATVDIICDRGAEWDGASMPRCTWSLLGIYPGGRMLAPSLAHDGWCETHTGNKPAWFHVMIHQKNTDLKITPYIRDLIFKESCRHVGVLKRRARIMWFAVMLYQRIECLKMGIKYK